jgi:hypothetical protein
MLMATMMERRGFVRAPISVLGAVETDAGEAPMLVLELSPSGARIQTDDKPDLEGVYKLHFTVHKAEYTTHFRVIHYRANDGTYHWGGSFLDLLPDQIAQLRRTVEAAAGIAVLSFREWDDVRTEASARPDEQIVVGFTPAGQEIRLSAHDCLDIGQEGVELFVHTVGNLEHT